MIINNNKIKLISIFIIVISFYFKPQPLYSRNLAQFERAKAEFTRGFKYFRNMQYLAAVEFFRRAVKEYPDYSTARDYLGRAYKLAGFLDEAQKEWEILYDINPNNVLIGNKLENIRLRDTKIENESKYSNLILYNIYRSNQFKRFSFDYPVDMVLDNEKNIYITSFSSGELVKIDPNGKGSFSKSIGFGSKLYGVDYFNNRLVVSDFKNDYIYIMSKSGDIIKKFGSSGITDGKFHGPQGVCIDNNNKIYVVDSGNHRVQKFNEKGEFILKFGKKGEYEKQFNNPTDIAHHKGKLIVSDTNNKRIGIYDVSGNFIKNVDNLDLKMPRGISTHDDVLLISDEKNGLLFYNPEKELKWWFNSWGKNEQGFSRLISSNIDRDGYLYCLDYNTESVSIFSSIQKRYSNLDVEITTVDINKFPVIAFYINIRNKNGSPIFGLKPDNFSILENNTPLRGVSVNYLKRLTPSVSTVICVDRSMENKGYHNEIGWLADFVLKKMRVNDSAKIMNFHSEVWPGSKFDWSRRRNLKAIRKRKYKEGKDFGTVLYNSISDLATRLNRRGVVLITDGSIKENSFKTYSVRNVVQYAKAHYVPVYIVSFKQPHPFLVRITEETGGKIIRPKEVDLLRKIYSNIKESDEYRYVLVYSTYKMKFLSGMWSDVKIEVNYKNQKGVEYGGYFIP